MNTEPTPERAQPKKGIIERIRQALADIDPTCKCHTCTELRYEAMLRPVASPLSESGATPKCGCGRDRGHAGWLDCAKKGLVRGIRPPESEATPEYEPLPNELSNYDIRMIHNALLYPSGPAARKMAREIRKWRGEENPDAC